MIEKMHQYFDFFHALDRHLTFILILKTNNLFL